MAQSFLPPAREWQGKSEELIAKPGNPWITPTEKSGFETTPDYQATESWLKKLDSASPLLHLVSIGKSVEGREIWMVIASVEKDITPKALIKSPKPLFLAQAGIHAGEIDGKDAGMMLLRDIAMGGKKSFIEKVNFLFIPILNVDGHERSSQFSRPNQRGPGYQGWRSNAQNLNLNRDFTKLDTKELRSVLKVINDYDPVLYMDIHVSDGADYQYDITYGGYGKQGYSPNIQNWLETSYKTATNKDLSQNGHLPGPLIFSLNDRDFSKGIITETGGPRFSDRYGDLRHLATILVENHSLKPFKQRVLGTYILLESSLKILSEKGEELRQVSDKDKAGRWADIPLSWKVSQFNTKSESGNKAKTDSQTNVAAPDSIVLAAISSEIRRSPITQSDYVEWLGQPVSIKVPHYQSTEPADFVSRPKGYWVPASCDLVIERLKAHGIKMETITQAKEEEVEMYRITEYVFGGEKNNPKPFQGRMLVKGKTRSEKRNQVFPKGSVFITTDQPLGDLAIILLEPASGNSFFSWGFFHSIFERTEYIEPYVMEPMAKKMLEDSPELRKEFEDKKASDTAFANNPNAILSWFYSKTQFYDDRFLLYPVGRK
jgi:hypothetical protein